jgi:FMN phosphatase YigB (HAD superfamily)
MDDRCHDHAVLHTFDVFDTCITRSLSVPSDVFAEMAERLCSEILPAVASPRDWIAEFVLGRIEAELDARKKSEFDEVTLTEIYEDFRALGRYQLQPQRVMQLELDLERELVSPITAVLDRVNALRQAGHRVVFISDIYHSTSFVRDLLLAAGFELNTEDLYVSSEYRCRKASGRLFRIVWEKEGVEPRQMLHTGDNPISDVDIPKKLGIQVQRSLDAEQNRYEREASYWLPEEDGVRRRMVGCMRSQRLAARAGIVPLDLAYSVAAPLLVEFITWVLNSAVKRNVRKLIFISRDGQILYKLAQRLVQPGGPELVYFHSSRKSIYTATMGELSAANLEWAFQEGHSLTIRGLLIRLGLATSDIREIFETGYSGEFAEADIVERFPRNKVIEWLQTGPVGAKLQRIALKQSRLLKSYLAAIRIKGSADEAYVDIGWRRGYQKVLNKVGQLCQWENDQHVYYAFAMAAKEGLSCPGSYSAFWSQIDCLPGDNRLAFPWRLASQFEAMFTPASHGPIEGYADSKDGISEPVFHAIPDWKAEFAYAEEFHEHLLRFADGYVRHGLHLSARRRPEHIFVHNLCMAFLEPRYSEIEGYRDLSFLASVDNNSESRYAILSCCSNSQCPPAEGILRKRGDQLRFKSHTLWPESVECIQRYENHAPNLFRRAKRVLRAGVKRVRRAAKLFLLRDSAKRFDSPAEFSEES